MPCARSIPTLPIRDSFLSGRFASLDAFTTQGRASILNAFGYRAADCTAVAEIVHRSRRGEFIREKIVFSTTPHFRVPAYVLIPKGRRGRAPAIVDLHSHGGMFLFGKEKVVDFGRNHPAMTTTTAELRGPTDRDRAGAPRLCRHHDRRVHVRRAARHDGRRPNGWDRTEYSVDEVQELNRSAGRRKRRW